MSDDMIERVARVLCARDRSRSGLRHWDDLNVHGQNSYRELARAAIEAMRVPTEPMIEAGMNYSMVLSGDAVAGLWTGMIDASSASNGGSGNG